MEFAPELSQKLHEGHHLRILIIEDNSIDSDVANHYISSCFPNSQTALAVSLKDAKEVLKREPFDFIILDLNLPDSKGLETLDRVMVVAKGIPLLIYTSIEDTNMALKAIEKGAQDYLLKGRGDAFTLKRVIQYSLLRKTYEQKLWHREAMLSAFIRNCPAGIVIVDRDMHIMMVSDRWLEDFKISYQHGEMVLLTEVFPECKELWHGAFDQCLHGELSGEIDSEFTGTDGKKEYMRWEMMPWHNEHGAIDGVILYMERTTERQQLLQALKRSKETLEQKVVERTSKLELTMLQLSKAQAAKSQFFTNMTHELRTPLHAILNFSSIGKRKLKSDNVTLAEECFDDIHKSGKRLLGLVDDILDLSKSQSGKMVVNLVPCSLHDILQDVVAEVSGILENKSMTIQINIADDIAMLPLDRARIHQVLINLISNAIKFSGEQTEIAISAHRCGNLENIHKGERVIVSVMDQGPGIPEEELSTIFNEFEQSLKVNSGQFSGGTGLGLAICKQIVEAHGGDIWARNNDTAGAGIYFTLPLEKHNLK